MNEIRGPQLQRTRSRRTRSQRTGVQRGLTLVELLVTLALAVVVLTVAAQMFAGSSRLVESDTGRVMALQNGQTALDMIVNDARQAGENMTVTGPALEVSGIEFGTLAPGRGYLTIRRNIPAEVQVQRLPVCGRPANRKEIQVAGPEKGKGKDPTPACAASDVNAERWDEYFAERSEAAQRGLLYCEACSAAASREIHSVVVESVEPPTEETVKGRRYKQVAVLLRAGADARFKPNDTTMLMLIDERRYFLDAQGTLRLGLAGQTDAEAQAVAYDIQEFTVTAALVDPAQTVGSMSLTGPWQRIEQLELTLKAGSGSQGRQNVRTFTARVFPRNVESSRGN